MISSISPESAFRFSGRFIVTTRVWPSCSTRAWGCDDDSVMSTMVVRNENVF
jgi:hypothetical protein